MSFPWLSLPAGATTRSGNLEAREQKRREIEAERLLKKKKSEQRRKLLEASALATPPPASSTTNFSENSTPVIMSNTGGSSTATLPASSSAAGQQPPPNPAGGVPPGNGGGGPPGGGGGGPPGGGPPGGPPGGNNGGQAQQGPPPAANQVDEVDYDLLDTQDGPRALESSGRITLQINLEDITFWFSEIESEMMLSGVGSQWLKLSVLRKNLPIKQREDVKSLLRLKKSEAGLTPYYDVKVALIKLYELKPKDTYKKALGRVLTGLPSQLGSQIADDVCDRPVKLRGCCCAKAVQALWTLQLPININQHISNMPFNSDTYHTVFDAADQVYLSAKNVSVASLQSASTTPAGFSINASAESPLNTAFSENNPSVAAVQQKKPKRPRNKNNKNQQNQGQGQAQKGRKGPRHPSNPPHSCCDNHFVHAEGAWFCQAPLTCPWKDKISARP